jgi:hypothetical protein
MLWQQHDEFISELKKICKKYRQVDDGVGRIKKLLAVQFHPQSPQEIIAPGKIHRVRADTTWEIWKVEVLVPKSGLKPNQWPRMWFGVSGETITLLAIVTHMQNYDNNTIDALALKRMTDVY